MRTRRLVAVLASAFLVLFLTATQTRPRELARRLRLVAHDAGRDLAVRRLDGSSAAFDRRFYFFLESARRGLPPGSPGVAVAAPSRTDEARNLVAYQFAPWPALLGPPVVPEGWVLAVYGTARPPAWREIVRVPGGALLVPAP